MFKRIFSYLLISLLLTSAINRPAQAVIFVPAVASSLSSWAGGSALMAARTAAFASIENGTAAHLIYATGVLAAAGVLLVAGTVSQESTRPVERTIIDVEQTDSPKSNQLKYLMTTTMASQSSNYDCEVYRGFTNLYPSSASDGQFLQSLYSGDSVTQTYFKTDGSIGSVSITCNDYTESFFDFLNPILDFLPSLPSVGSSGFSEYGGNPANTLDLSTAQSLADADNLDLNFPALFWDAIPNKPPIYQNLSYSDALDKANELSGEAPKDSLEDFPLLPLLDGGFFNPATGLSSNGAGELVDASGQVLNPDGTVTETDGRTSTIDYARIASIFNQIATSSASTVTTAVNDLKTEVGKQTAALETITAASIATQNNTASIDTNLDSIKTELTTPSSNTTITPVITFSASLERLYNGIKNAPFVSAIGGLVLPSYSGASCPTISVDAFGGTASTNVHCQIVSENQGFLVAIFLALWGWIAINIFLRA
ncbi:hypothetical protein [Thiomicrorhabdus cannonii]|uniref:hypothetical protein n=1 Tax=Thiomicrorhabdus cannonii TaxID=2748011 RepID=UPI0015BE120C|nr:hypothetical protein [Thiomicrorhabdus cannonii]